MTSEFEKELKVEKTNTPDLLVFDLPIHDDNHDWLRGNWQYAKMIGLGLPDFSPVQNNTSYSTTKNVIRGIHAGSQDKYISITAGETPGAWIDLRPDENSGQVFAARLDPGRTIHVPRGVDSSFQALQGGAVYTYLMSAHWSFEQKKTYTLVSLADPELNTQWSIPLEESRRSETDLHHPMLRDAKPMAPRRTLVTGYSGQLGHVIRTCTEVHGLEGFEYTDIDEFDFSNPKACEAYDWNLCDMIIDAGTCTIVDKAKTAEDRPTAWKASTQSPALLVEMAKGRHITLVYVSSGYVFDNITKEHMGTEAFTPFGVYNQAKATGGIAVANTPKYYILCSSWVIDEGRDFMEAIMMLSNETVDPNDKLGQVTMMDDQYGRLTFTKDMAEAIFHLLNSHAPYGIYNSTDSGAVESWASITAEMFDLTSDNGSGVKPIGTAEYFTNVINPVSPRPVNPALDLAKTGEAEYVPTGWEKALETYVQKKLDR